MEEGREGMVGGGEGRSQVEWNGSVSRELEGLDVVWRDAGQI